MCRDLWYALNNNIDKTAITNNLCTFIDGIPYCKYVYNNIGLAYFNKGYYNEAIDNYNKALEIKPDDVILIEGTVALALSVPPQLQTNRYHLHLDERQRRLRVLREYELRGFDEDKAIEIYQQRVADEFPVIEQLAVGSVRLDIPELQP